MRKLRRLLIGRRTFKVTYADLISHYGWYVPNAGTVQLDSLSGGEEAAYALMHEALHGIWDAKRLGTRVREERACEELGRGLVELFRDNPGLTAYIEALVKDAR